MFESTKRAGLIRDHWGLVSKEPVFLVGGGVKRMFGLSVELITKLIWPSLRYSNADVWIKWFSTFSFSEHVFGDSFRQN